VASRALPDLVARIRLDSTGVDAGLQNLIGSFGKANLAMAGIAAGIGLLIVGGKSMIEISEKHDAAVLGLEQAYRAAHTQLSKYQGGIDAFISSNERFISDQSQVIDGFATFTRAGLRQSEVTKDMNRALDLAAIKHIDLSEAVKLINNAEHGRLRGLIDLGITSAKYVDSSGHVINANKNMARVMAELDAKTKGGRNTMTTLTQDSNRLSNDWQHLAQTGGPVLITAIDKVVLAAQGLYDVFDNLGKDDHLWATISKRLTDIANGTRAVGLQLGIAYDTQGAAAYQKTVYDPRAFHPDPALRDARLAAAQKGAVQYQAEMAKEEKAFYAQQAKDDKAFAAAMAKQNADQLEYLKAIAGNTSPGMQRPVTVVLDTNAIADAIRKRDRSLR
jgi:hypothetical protein